MPVFHEFVDEFRLGLLQRSAVEADAGARILRRQADNHRLLDSVGGHLVYRIGGAGPPVAHADVNGKSEQLCSSIRLLERDLGQGRATDQGVAASDFFYYRRRQRTSAGDIEQELGDFSGRIGAAVRKKKDRLLHAGAPGTRRDCAFWGGH